MTCPFERLFFNIDCKVISLYLHLGSDFQIESALQSYTFYPGEDNVTIPLTILNDQIPEASENLLLSLSIPPGPNVGTYQIGTNPSTVVNINDDDSEYTYRLMLTL